MCACVRRACVRVCVCVCVRVRACPYYVCRAVNWWYDMAYDVRYNYFTFIERLSHRLHAQMVQNP